MEKILIAEDDRRIAQLEQDYLESNGFATAWVADGAQVTPAMKRDHYDLVLLDIMFPGCSGYDICRTVRELKLPNREFELLRFLAQNPNIVFLRKNCLKKYGAMITYRMR